MRFGLAVTYDDQSETWREWWTGQEVELWQSLIGQVIVGWNVFDFDLSLLMAKANQAGYEGDCWLDPMTIVDLMAIIKRESQKYGKERWYKLEVIAQANIGRGKSGDGQKACEWLRSGDPEQMRLAADYCKLDVQLCVDLLRVAQADGLLCPARPDRGEVGDIRIWIDKDGEPWSEMVR